MNRLRHLVSVTLLQLLPPTNSAGLHADHVLPAALGLKVAEAEGLVDPGVEDDGVLEVLARDAELGGTGRLRDGDVLGAGGRVDAVRLAGEGDGAGLGLSLEVVDLVDVGGVFEAGDLDGFDVLGFFVISKMSLTV